MAWLSSVAPPRVGDPPDRRLQHPQAEGQPDQPLLGAVVQVAFEPAALCVAGLDQPETGGSQVLDLRQRLGPQLLVLEPEVDGRHQVVGRVPARERARPVDQRAPACARVLEPRQHPAAGGRRRDAAGRGIHEPRPPSTG